MKRAISMVSMVTAMTVVLLMLFASDFPAYAQMENPCAKDFAQFCYYVTPGGGRLVQCYEENKDKMSGACRAWAEGAKSNAAALKEACSKDIDTRCNIEKGDPLGMLNCLQGNYVSLTSDCVQALNQFKYRYTLPAR